MMASNNSSRTKPKASINEIRDAQQRLLQRRRRVDIRAAMLGQNIRRKLTAPATLLLAGGIGFMIGELTTRSFPNNSAAADTPSAAATTPLKTVLNLISLAHTLYTALPRSLPD